MWPTTTLNFGRGGGGGLTNCLPSNLLQITHWCTNLWTNAHPLTIQYFDRNSVRLSLIPLWKTFSRALFTISIAKWWLCGTRMGCLVWNDISALERRPPHLQTPFRSVGKYLVRYKIWSPPDQKKRDILSYVNIECPRRVACVWDCHNVPETRTFVLGQ